MIDKAVKIILQEMIDTKDALILDVDAITDGATFRICILPFIAGVINLLRLYRAIRILQKANGGK